MIVIQVVSVNSFTKGMQKQYIESKISFDYNKYKITKFLVNESNQQEFLKNLYSNQIFRRNVRKIQIFEKNEYRGDWNSLSVLERK